MNWYDDPTGLAAKLSALAGAIVATVSVVVDLVAGGGFDAPGLTGALTGLITAALGVLADLAARRRAIAPVSLVRATANPPVGAPLPHDLERLRAGALNAR